MSDMKYRIMIVAARKDKNKSLYKYLLDGDQIYEATALEEIDAKIEKMLNEEDYSKNDFIVVSELQFNVFANVVDNTELRDDTVANPEEPPVDGGNTGDDANDNSSTDGGDNNEPEWGDGIDGVEPDITDPDNVTP